MIIAENALDVKVAPINCQSCQAKQLTIEAVGAPKLTTCVFCDPNFSHAIRPAYINKKLGFNKQREKNFDGERRNNFNRRGDHADKKRRFNNKVRDGNFNRGPRNDRRNNSRFGQNRDNSYSRDGPRKNRNFGRDRQPFGNLQNQGGYTNRDNMNFNRNRNNDMGGLKQKNIRQQFNQRGAMKQEDYTPNGGRQTSMYKQINPEFNFNLGPGQDQPQQGGYKPRSRPMKIEPKYEDNFQGMVQQRDVHENFGMRQQQPKREYLPQMDSNMF